MRSRPRSSFAGARVLAIDLSLTSLAYALRKTRELGVGNIEYAQADILKLDTIGRTFDVIESSGVLHHMADPFAGWRTLLSVLRPGGVMAVALYSEIARADIVRARAFIAERGYGSSADDIRRCRQDIVAHEDGQAFKNVYASADFYSTSDCRDLLFHVQEHRHTIPQIAGFIAENALEFVGVRDRSGDCEPVSHEVSRRHRDDGSRLLGRIRARTSQHFFRHVPVLGAEGGLTDTPFIRQVAEVHETLA